MIRPAPAAGLGALLLGALLLAPVSASATSSPPAVASSPAGAASSPRCTDSMVTTARQTIEADLTARVTQLNSLVARVDGDATVVPSDKAALLADLTRTELPGIAGLDTKVAADATCAELRQDAHAMVYDYRVYLVMTPQTDLVAAGDAAEHTHDVLDGLEPVVSGALRRAQDDGHNVSGAEAIFADFESQTAAAQTLLAGESATVLAQAPSDYPASRLVFVQARTTITDADHDLKAARDDLARIIDGAS